MPVRISKIAEKLGLSVEAVLAKAKALGIHVKYKHMGLSNLMIPSTRIDKIAGKYLETELLRDLAAAATRGIRLVELGNFKAFADTQSVRIAPLTLIFGANSSGKSSLIHGLLLWRHALDTGELDVFRTDIGGDSVDLGGFHQYVHRRDPSRRVEWAVGLDPSSLRGQAARLLGKAKDLTLKLSFGVPLDDHSQPLLGEPPRLITYEVESDGRVVLRMSRRPDGTLQVDRVEQEALKPVVDAMLLSFTTTEHIDSQPDAEAVAQAFTELIPKLRFSAHRVLPDQLVGEDPDSPHVPELIPIGKSGRREEIIGSAKLFIPRVVAEFVASLNSTLDEQLSRIAYLGPLRSFPPRHFTFAEEKDRNWLAGGGYAWEVVTKDDAVREKVNAWLGKPDRLQTPYRLDVRRYIAPEEAEKILSEEFLNVLMYRAKVENPGEYGVISEITHVDDKLEEASVHVIRMDNDELARNTIQRILSNPSGTHLDDLVLRDLRTDTVVSHRDVGIGVSQVLPVLVHAYADQGQIVAIEQPEIHLHQALQAELGDVFIESALGEQRNTFLLETHSEHLILRILRRVRETTEKKLPPGAIPVRPEDVSVLFVEPTPNGSVIRHMHVTPDGDFAEPWPGGFFAERLKDLP